jgi:hypothetical protein
MAAIVFVTGSGTGFCIVSSGANRHPGGDRYGGGSKGIVAAVSRE